jgi:hypothetical protein
MALPRRLDRGAMSLPCHAGNGGAESCWRWHSRGYLALLQCCCQVMIAMVLPSHAGNGVAEVTWPRHDRSLDVRPELRSMTRAVMCDRRWDQQPESRCTYIRVYNG